MAEAVISGLLDRLASIARERVEKKVRLVMGVDADAKNLRRNLEAIQTVLKDAEKRQLKEDGVKLWLEDLKDMSYDMDSVLDEYITSILKSKFEEQEEDGLINEGADTITKKKVCFSILLSFLCCGKLSDHDHRIGIAEKIQVLNERLDNIVIRKDRFNFKIASGNDIDELKRPNTTSLLDVPVVYGQGGYKSVLIDRLMFCGSQEEKKIQVIPIVGMGGIGKTTLAKHVFNDDKVNEHFGGQRIWVCVSDPFNRDQIFKEIIEQLTGQILTTAGSEALMQRFRESIKGKKFLLVLDDVWTSKYRDWEPLEQALKCGDVESRVVLTTRKEEVAKMVGDKHMICMNKLSEEDCWLLLSEIAFFGKTDLKCLRTLRLSGKVPDLPSNIGELRHLRYLSLEDVDRVIKLPPAIGYLFNLQTLRLLRCQVTELPKEVGDLINLKHLYASYIDISWPKGVGRLRSLQTLKTIKISAKSENFQLRDLQNMNSLQDIHLEQLGIEEHVEEAIQAQIVHKVNLLNLSLMFVGDDPKIIDTHNTVLEALQPHENLKSLAISCYYGQSISPSWMISLVNLKRLHLRRCHMCESLPPLGKLSSLESLDVSEASGLKKIGLEFLGIKVDNSDGQGISSISDSLFPKLKRISIEKAPSLADWAGAPGWKVDSPLKIMPRLEFLLFDHCSRLKSLPDFLEAAPLKYLTILDSPALERSCKKETGTDWPKICHVPHIKISRTSGKRTTT